MKTVIVYGTFDFFHYGHYNLFKQAKELGDYLIVGVSSDDLCKLKGKNPILNEQQRMEIISNIKFVDKVILETSFEQKIDDIDTYNVDIYCDGEDYKDVFPKTEVYNKIKDKVKVVFLKRTPNVSTTIIKKKLMGEE